MGFRRGAPLLAIGCVIAALLLTRFRPTWTLIAETARSGAAAAAVVLASIATGFAVAALARRVFGAARAATPTSDALLIGFPTFGSVVAMVAWTGVALDVLVAIMTMALAVSGAIAIWRTGRRPLPDLWHPLLLVPILVALAMAIVPVTSPDELIYKLAVPHAWQMFGGMIELPLSSHSYATLAPHGTDLASLVLSGGIAAKMARFALYLAALVVLMRLASRYTTRPSWVVAILAWTPALAVIAGWCWDEWGLIGLFALSLERWLQWTDSSDSQSLAVCYAVLGAAVATKYTALPWLAGFAVVIAFHGRRSLALHLRGLLLIAILGGLFYVRNMIWTGSPVAPFLEPGAPPVLDYRTSQSFGGWRELFSGAYIFDRGMIDESLGILLPLAVIASLFAVRRRDARDLLIIGALQIPIMLTLSPIAHNLAPALVPLTVVGGAILTGLGTAWRVFASLVIIPQAIVIAFVLQTYDLDFYIGGSQDAATYVSTRFDFAKPYAWIHHSTGHDARVLLLGETRSFYLDRQFIAGGNLDGPRIAAWLGAQASPAGLHAELRRLGITHVLLNRAAYRIQSPQARPLTLIEREKFLEVPPAVHATLSSMLQSHGTVRYNDAQHLIVELRP